jgi:ribosomal protein L37AE/L43A
MNGTADRWNRMQARVKKWDREARERNRTSVLSGYCPDCRARSIQRTFFGLQCTQCKNLFYKNGYPERKQT